MDDKFYGYVLYATLVNFVSKSKVAMPDSYKGTSSLPDYIDYNLVCLSVGLNPSILSAQLGYYFANPRNRFWRAFNQSKIIGVEITPDSNVHKKLLREYSIGFTDVVKRPSRMGHELLASDFKRDAPALRAKIEKYVPELVWFHGKVAVSKFLKYGYGVKMNMDWGFNEIPQLDMPLLVTPNPSPANAVYSLDDLIEYYRVLSKCDRF